MPSKTDQKLAELEARMSQTIAAAVAAAMKGTAPAQNGGNPPQNPPQPTAGARVAISVDVPRSKQYKGKTTAFNVSGLDGADGRFISLRTSFKAPPARIDGADVLAAVGAMLAAAGYKAGPVQVQVPAVGQ